MSDGPILEVEGLVKDFHEGLQLLGGGGTVHAVDGVSLTIGPGEVGLVGSDHFVACHLVGPGGAAPVAPDLTAGGV
jgi:hypothetical protein